MKFVDYRGNTYEVPNEAKFIATDSDGLITWFTDKPFIGNLFVEWFGNHSTYCGTGGGGRTVSVGEEDCPDWRESLEEI